MSCRTSSFVLFSLFSRPRASGIGHNVKYLFRVGNQYDECEKQTVLADLEHYGRYMCVLCPPASHFSVTVVALYCCFSALRLLSDEHRCLVLSGFIFIFIFILFLLLSHLIANGTHSCRLWSLRPISPPGSRFTNFYRGASSVSLQFVNGWILLTRVLTFPLRMYVCMVTHIARVYGPTR